MNFIFGLIRRRSVSSSFEYIIIIVLNRYAHVPNI